MVGAGTNTNINSDDISEAKPCCGLFMRSSFFIQLLSGFPDFIFIEICFVEECCDKRSELNLRLNLFLLVCSLIVIRL